MRRLDSPGLVFHWPQKIVWTVFLILQGCSLFFSQAEIWIEVPFVSAGNPFCGHACASMLIRYWSQKGFPTGTPDLPPIKTELPFDPGRGASASDLVSFFQARGCQAFAFKGTRVELGHHLQKGRPLIVGLGKKKGANHFVVVTGIDQGGRYIAVNDPADRQMVKSAWEKFNREWSRTGNWTLLVLPPAAGH